MDDRYFAIAVEEVERGLRAAQVTAVPDGPEFLLGLANVKGRILPVVDIRRRLGLPGREIDPDDRLIILATKIPICFFVDAFLGVLAFDKETLRKPKDIYPNLERILAGVGMYDEETVLVLDVKSLFAELMDDKSLHDLLVAEKAESRDKEDSHGSKSRPD